MSCGVGHRCGSDPAWLWLWCRPAAVALIHPLAWEPPCAVGASLKRQIKKKERKKKRTWAYMASYIGNKTKAKHHIARVAKWDSKHTGKRWNIGPFCKVCYIDSSGAICGLIGVSSCLWGLTSVLPGREGSGDIFTP